MTTPRILQTLQGQITDTTPIWLMRQAGRYLPEYRKIRLAAGSFLNLCKNPELACEVTLQPLRRFDLDAAILFSDILVIPEAMGMELGFFEGEGPRFSDPVRSEQDVKALQIVKPDEHLPYVLQTIKFLKSELPADKPLIGFSGSPWTLACYMIDGSGTSTFQATRGMRYQSPKIVRSLLEKLEQSVAHYLSAQIHAGVDIVMLFDTWGGLLNQTDFDEFSLQPMKRIMSTLREQHETIPILLFSKGANETRLCQIASSECDGVGVDWTIDLQNLTQLPNGQTTLQGNLDPLALMADKTTLMQQIKNIMSNAEILKHNNQVSHIFNLGHGIIPTTPPDNVALLVDTVHKLGQR